MQTIFRSLNILIVFILLMVGCTPSQIIVPTVDDVENSIRVFPTATQLPTVVKPSVSPELIATPTNVSMPSSTEVVSWIGTPLPSKSEGIDQSNYLRLKKVGQWGRGSIQGVSFTPDGQSFVAISELGWSIYSMSDVSQSPQWVAFGKPSLFDEFHFSKDGTIVKFYDYGYDQTRTYVKKFPSGEVLDPRTEAEWLKPESDPQNHDLSVYSPDGTKLFTSSLVYEFNEALFSEEKTIREMKSVDGNLLYSLRDDAPYVTYSDRHGPEGCDLSVFSPCGNALMALATTPKKVLFSSDSATFAILYDPPGLYSGILNSFSYLRIYDSANGNLIGSLGGFSKPVQDFDYSPDGKLLVAGFVDGSIVLWDIMSAQIVFGARHMNAPIERLVYSGDSKYLLLQRGEELEVRLAANGNLLYRFDTVEFAVSSINNLVALGDTSGNIQIRDLDTGKGIRTIKAHEARIYSLAFSPDGLYLASSGQDCDIKLWDLKTGKLLHYFEETTVDAYEIDSPSRIFSTYLEFVPNKNMLIGFGSWGTVVSWNVNSGATNYVIQSDALQYYNGMITLKPHFPEFFSVEEGTDRFYINENQFDLTNGEKLGVFQSPANLPKGCAAVGPRSKDQKLLFTLGYENNDGKICILNANTMELLNRVDVPWANWLYLSPDGEQLVVTAGSGIVYVFQIV